MELSLETSALVRCVGSIPGSSLSIGGRTIAVLGRARTEPTQLVDQWRIGGIPDPLELVRALIPTASDAVTQCRGVVARRRSVVAAIRRGCARGPRRAPAGLVGLACQTRCLVCLESRTLGIVRLLLVGAGLVTLRGTLVALGIRCVVVRRGVVCVRRGLVGIRGSLIGVGRVPIGVDGPALGGVFAFAFVSIVRFHHATPGPWPGMDAVHAQCNSRAQGKALLSPRARGTNLRQARLRATGVEVAEGVGFEPTVGCPTSVFKTDAFVHSATPPRGRHGSASWVNVDLTPPIDAAL